jgi:hypothetical protein
MASRLTTGVASSQNGNQYGAGQAGSSQIDLNISSMPSLALSSALSTAIIGTTIRGSVVSAIEVWADGCVWDTTNSRALIPGSDYDITLLHRSM